MIEEKEWMMRLLAVIVRGKIDLEEEEEEIIEAAGEIEEEASEKEDSEGISEEEREKWNRLGEAATMLMKAIRQKNGKKSTMVGIEKEKEEAEKREPDAKEAKEKADREMKMMKERAEKEKTEVEEKLLAMTQERDRLQKRIDEEKRKEEEERKRYVPITSLSNTRVYMPKTDNIKCEGNRIIHHGSDIPRNAVIGKAMTDVCLFSHLLYGLFIDLLSLIGNVSHVYICLFSFSPFSLPSSESLN